jgi:hypothetical protein
MMSIAPFAAGVRNDDGDVIAFGSGGTTRICDDPALANCVVGPPGEPGGKAFGGGAELFERICGAAIVDGGDAAGAKLPGVLKGGVVGGAATPGVAMFGVGVAMLGVDKPGADMLGGAAGYANPPAGAPTLPVAGEGTVVLPRNGSSCVGRLRQPPTSNNSVASVSRPIIASNPFDETATLSRRERLARPSPSPADWAVR